MHPLAANKMVESIRRRVKQGDCPTEPAFSVELLEDLVEELASRSVPLTSSESTISEEERRDISELEGIRDGLRRSAISRRAAARATPDEYLRNTWNDKADEHDRQADFWTRLIDRLSSAPSRGSESDEPLILDKSRVEAAHEAVAAIYFADSSDYLSALYSVVRRLDPDLAELLESNPGAAYDGSLRLVEAVVPLVTESAGGTNG